MQTGNGTTQSSGWGRWCRGVRALRIGLFIDSTNINASSENRASEVEDAEKDGFDSFWLSHVFGADALTLVALAGQRTERIEIGTAVVPTFPRHPAALAQQALATQMALGGRLTLGIGPSHRSSMEGWLGLSYDKPVRHLREYLTVLRSLIEDGEIDFTGEVFSVRSSLQVPGATPCPILVGALGPMMLRVTGELADGTITWMAGPRTISGHVVPRINEASSAAGRPSPRVCVGVPIAVTDDRQGARRRAARLLEGYARVPSYRRMLVTEGVDSPADAAIIGTEVEVEAGIRALSDAGATDLLASLFPVGDPASAERTRELLKRLVGQIEPVPQ